MDALLRRRAMIADGGGTPPPPGVVFYDRLVFDGTAYIDTNIVPPENASFRVTPGYETLKAAQRLFMCDGTNGSTFGALLNTSTTSTQRNFNVYYGGTGAVGTNKTYAFSNNTYQFFLTPKRFGWGSTAYTITKGNNTPNGGLVIGSNISHTGQPFTGRIGNFFIYGSDAQNVTTASGFSSYTPVYSLKPCTYYGEPGLWCVETSTFFGNSAGSGSLSVLNN